MVFDTRDFGVLVRFFNRLMGVIPSMELQRRNRIDLMRQGGDGDGV